MLSFLVGFIFLGILFGIFLAGGLFFRKENYFANHILTLLLLIISAALTNTLFLKIDIVPQTHTLRMAYITINFLISPLFYLYVRAFTTIINRIRISYLLHLIPALVVLLIPEFISVEENGEVLELYIPIFLHIQGIIYLLFMFNSMNKYRKKIKNYFSEINVLRLTWMIFLLVFFTLVVLSSLLISLLWFYFESLPRYFFSITSLLTLVFFYITAYYTIRQPEIFSKIKEMENTLDDSVDEVEKNNIVVEKKLLQQLIKLMDNSKPYKDNELTLNKLSNELSIAPHKLSRVLAVSEEHNFYSFVNNYRIKEVKLLLRDKDYKNRTVLDLAFEAGFSSKSNFNNIFKKSVGITPSQFRKKYNTN